MTVYTCEAVQKLINQYLECGGTVIEMREGVLGCGDLLLIADGYKTTVVTEVPISGWSSGHKVRMYNKTPAKYQRFIDAQ